MATYTVFFTSSGAPASGLTPTISWRYLDGTSPGTPPTVSEIDAANAPGWYKFDASPAQDIVVTVDGGAALPAAERYVAMTLTPDDRSVTEARLAALDAPYTGLKTAIADQVWDEARADHVAAGSFGEGVNVQAVNAGAINAGSFAAAAIDAAALAPDAANEVAAAVWEAKRADFAQPGSFGEGVNVQAVNAGAINAGSFAAAAIDAAALAATAVAEIADQVWDEPRADHVAAGSFGEGVRIATGGTNDTYAEEVADAVWSDAVANRNAAGSMGDAVRRMVGLRQDNMRMVVASYHESGQPQTGSIYIYPSAADAAADTNRSGEWSFTATYDESGRLASYLTQRVA